MVWHRCEVHQEQGLSREFCSSWARLGGEELLHHGVSVAEPAGQLLAAPMLLDEAQLVRVEVPFLIYVRDSSHKRAQDDLGVVLWERTHGHPEPSAPEVHLSSSWGIPAFRNCSKEEHTSMWPTRLCTASLLLDIALHEQGVSAWHAHTHSGSKELTGQSFGSGHTLLLASPSLCVAGATAPDHMEQLPHLEEVDLHGAVAEVQGDGSAGAEPRAEVGQPGQLIPLPRGDVGARLQQVLAHVVPEVFQ